MNSSPMKIKKIQAATVKEAMRQIRREFGDDAVILNTRNIDATQAEQPDARVEVTAGVYQEVVPESNGSKQAVQPSSDALPVPEKEGAQMHETILQMQQTIDRLTVDIQYPDAQKLPLPYREWYLYLAQQEIDSYLTKSIIRDVLDELGENTTRESIQEKIEREIEDIFLESPAPLTEERQRIITMVGPTGVGKTTTIAKLATQKSLEEGRSVALVTADTYRVAATDQIRMFANLLEVPIEVVYTPDEMAKAISRFDDYDYIFIDTTGRSQNDKANIQQIQEMLESADPDEMHLVMSATTSPATLRAVANRFSLLPVTDLLISKIDEAEAVGSVLSMLQQYSWPVSYFTNGQNVPEDIMVGTAAGYCELLFGDLE